MAKFLILLPTSKTGYATTIQLLREGNPVRIYARSENEKVIALLKMGAEIIIGELNDKNQLSLALDGIQNVYYCYPYMPGMSNAVALFIEVAIKAQINAIVFMGQRIAAFDDTGSALTKEVRKSYELLERSGLNVVYFAPGYFADNVFVIAEYVLQLGIMPNPFGNGKNPWISTDDMNRCLVALLKNPEPYFGQKLFPTGSKSISATEIAAVFSKIRGKKVVKINIPEWMFLKAGMLSGSDFGFDEFAIIQATFYNKQMQMNRFDMAPNNLVKELTGQEAEDFETITQRHFSKSNFKNPNWITRISAFIKFNKIPFTRIPNKKQRALLNQ